ncbi:acyl-homoserine-lactone synthase [Notoacmeibacter sp. MSK16QG-6]|uniref:acyl-homoserine-lactone synthase n=1 Tax=Notoacmeibacter sp. MSK16QG-6 TaxID=2957982 RepID=UPI00209F933B|nr:acyl-homoserine-lactone synthase [Notoacmeibacter sp. MSK16QG-6]MCP1200488.1 autoinducer synthase [Notoacmeibacter sp. MSK16QG-6]
MRTLIIDAYNLGRNHGYWLDHLRLRREIFVDRLGWELPCTDELEFDCFDTPAAHYVLTIDDDDRVCAVSRLLPTTVRYMIEELWPDWPYDGCPHSMKVWEASRFGCSAHLTHAQRQEAIRVLFREIYTFGQDHGIDHYMMVMPKFIFERLIRPNGYCVEYIGDSRKIDGVLTCLGKVSIKADRAADPGLLLPEMRQFDTPARSA